MKRKSLLAIVLLAGVPWSLLPSLAGGRATPESMPKEETSLETLTDDPAAKHEVEKWERASRNLLRNHLPTIAARGDADSLLAATLLWPEIGDAPSSRTNKAERREIWFEAATRVSPRDATVAWVGASDCPVAEGVCYAKAALDFLLNVEPDNAAVQLLAMRKTGDGDTAEHYWRAAAAADVYNTHAREIGKLLHDAMQYVVQPPMDPQLAETLGSALGLNRGMTPDDARNVYALAAWMALAIPTLKSVTDRCRTQEGTTMDSSRKEQCRKVLALLAEDQSTVIAPLVGLSLLVRLDGDTPEGLVSRERLRQLHWIYENALPNSSGGGRTSAFPDDYAEIVLLEGEVQAMRHVLESRNLPASAPDQWLPSSENARALVTIGRLPQS
jgi:hypothetical protein